MQLLPIQDERIWDVDRMSMQKAEREGLAIKPIPEPPAKKTCSRDLITKGAIALERALTSILLLKTIVWSLFDYFSSVPIFLIARVINRINTASLTHSKIKKDELEQHAMRNAFYILLGEAVELVILGIETDVEESTWDFIQMILVVSVQISTILLLFFAKRWSRGDETKRAEKSVSSIPRSIITRGRLKRGTRRRRPI